MIEIWLAFSAGIIGSVHCLGMCGGFVAAMSMSVTHQGHGSRIRSHLLYNFGRITTYTILGAAAGLIGSTMNLPMLKTAGVSLFALANIFIILVGIASIAGFGRFNLNQLESSGGGLMAIPLRRLLSSRSSLVFYPVGLLLGFLPCGMVYAPLAAAMATGSALHGATVMAALGLGTLPLMFFFGTAAATVSIRIQAVMFRILGLIVLFMGLSGLWKVLAKSGLLNHIHL
ncbi:MAG: hypothetical protein A2079_06805 [Geobacteraceae bacterium GWC2_48_7]|nr:MAG: hypothetical protein A2079_06805 [Geobacteraceae bacterium GWC2_48_7]